MIWIIRSTIVLLFYQPVLCFWDMGTTTLAGPRDGGPRRAMFVWQKTEREFLWMWYKHLDWMDIRLKRRLCMTVGFSIYTTNLGVGTILNRRTLLTSANFLEPWKDVEKDIRVWALGRGGNEDTPYRYRVWRVRRLIPRSNNPEHWHGPRGRHVPRHDLAIVHTMDQMYLFPYLSKKLHYATRALLFPKKETLPENTDVDPPKRMFFAGSGFEDMVHIRQNFRIKYHLFDRDLVVDCSKYLPKWWGKFICFRNRDGLSGVSNGGGLFTYDLEIVAVGCFEIRYNEDRILVFTDLRYYIDQVHVFSNISLGEYYEYAYQMWGTQVGYMSSGKNDRNAPFLPYKYVKDDYYPLGK